jgi:hypothetical protein
LLTSRVYRGAGQLIQALAGLEWCPESLSRGWVAHPCGSNDVLRLYLRCADDSFHVGSAQNLEDRVKAHNDGRGAAYTFKHVPFAWCIPSRSAPKMTL